MALTRYERISRTFCLTSLIFCCSINVVAQKPSLGFEDGKVWAKNINAEILFLFSRYNSTTDDWASAFPVSTKESIDGITIAGSYHVFKDAVSFTPRFPFVPNVEYKATLFLEQLALNPNEVYLPKIKTETICLDFSIAKSSPSLPSLKAVYPSADTLPENLLKFHFEFSKSMTHGMAYSKIKLLNSKGEVIDKPFLIVDQELWDTDYKTLTILLDPGRIKRGLRPNIEMQPALKAQENYSLVIEPGWKDIDGAETNSRFVKTFTCEVADRTSPAPDKFVIKPPTESSELLVIDFQESIDFMLIEKTFAVYDDTGNVVEGTMVFEKGEFRVAFVPKNPWIPMRYKIVFNPLAEDLAGNNLNRPFDKELNFNHASERPLLQTEFIFEQMKH